MSRFISTHNTSYWRLFGSVLSRLPGIILLRLLQCLHCHGCGLCHSVDGLNRQCQSDFVVDRRSHHHQNLRQAFRGYLKALLFGQQVKHLVNPIPGLITDAQRRNKRKMTFSNRQRNRSPVSLVCGAMVIRKGKDFINRRNQGLKFYRVGVIYEVLSKRCWR